MARLDGFSDMSMKQKYKLYKIKKIGYLDIETSGLKADFDIILSYAILIRDVKNNTTKIVSNAVRSSDFQHAHKKHDADLIDERILKSLIKDISTCDLLVGHWFIGKHRHDMPFIRTRCAINKINGLPKYKQVRYGDTQKWGSLLYRLHNFGLDSLAGMFDISTKKTRLEPKIWKNACIGIPSAIKYILDHNIKDVKITYKVHKGMEEYVPIPATYA